MHKFLQLKCRAGDLIDRIPSRMGQKEAIHFKSQSRRTSCKDGKMGRMGD